MFKILIIDPNTPFRRSLKKILVNRFPFADIEEAIDEKDGMDSVFSFHPELIFLEINLPGENGLNLARRIKAVRPQIVVILLTSYNLPEYQTAADESEIEYLVPKDDWTGEDIIDLVRSILSDFNVDEDTGHNKILPHGKSS